MWNFTVTKGIFPVMIAAVVNAFFFFFWKWFNELFRPQKNNCCLSGTMENTRNKFRADGVNTIRQDNVNSFIQIVHFRINGKKFPLGNLKAIMITYQSTNYTVCYCGKWSSSSFFFVLLFAFCFENPDLYLFIQKYYTYKNTHFTVGSIKIKIKIKYKNIKIIIDFVRKIQCVCVLLLRDCDRVRGVSSLKGHVEFIVHSLFTAGWKMWLTECLWKITWWVHEIREILSRSTYPYSDSFGFILNLYFTKISKILCFKKWKVIVSVREGRLFFFFNCICLSLLYTIETLWLW